MIIEPASLVQFAVNIRIFHPLDVKPCRLDCKPGIRWQDCEIFTDPENMMLHFGFDGWRQPAFSPGGCNLVINLSPMPAFLVRQRRIHPFRMETEFRVAVPYFPVPASPAVSLSALHQSTFLHRTAQLQDRLFQYPALRYGSDPDMALPGIYPEGYVLCIAACFIKQSD